MKDLMTGEELTFTCQKWMSRDEDDGEICREMPAQRISETPVQLLPGNTSLMHAKIKDIQSQFRSCLLFMGN